MFLIAASRKLASCDTPALCPFGCSSHYLYPTVKARTRSRAVFAGFSGSMILPYSVCVK